MPPKKKDLPATVTEPATEARHHTNAPIIVHLADLHIRCGTLATSRYEEYATVFKRITDAVQSLALQARDAGRPLAVVIAGDIFHSKLKIESRCHM